MPKFIVGARLHDYGKGSPDELFGRVAADGFAAVQLAYKKCVPSVRSYADVTDALVAETVAAEKAHSIQVAVLGTYVELAINDESRLKNAADFKSQLAVCKVLGAGCIGTETTSMEKQPAGTTREEAQELLCRSLADILPAAEELGVTVAVEPVTYHSMNSAAATRHILETMRSPNLKVIFDMSNLVDAGNVGAQDRIWNDVGELLGDQIVAVHFKGQAFAPDGGLLHTSLEDSLTDYAGAFAMLRQLPQDALPVLREEAVPAPRCQRYCIYERIFCMIETERKTLVVDESGAGDYRTLTEAVAACAATPDEPVRFYIRHGIYEERPFIELADYVIEGRVPQRDSHHGVCGRARPVAGRGQDRHLPQRNAVSGRRQGRCAQPDRAEQRRGRRKGRSGAGRLRRRNPRADGECEPLRQPGHAVHRSPAPAGAREERLPRPAGEHAPAGHRAVLQKLHDPRQHRLYLWRCKRCVRHLPP